MRERRINVVIRLILIAFIAVVIAKYVMVNVISGYRNEKKEDEKTVDIFKNVVALIDSRITDKHCTFEELYGLGRGKMLDKSRTEKNFERINNSTGIRFIDAKVDGISNDFSMRRGNVWMRYRDKDGYNFYVNFVYSDDRLARCESGEDVIWNGIEGDIKIYSDYDTDIVVLDGKTERNPNLVNIDYNLVASLYENGDGYKKEFDCMYISKVAATLYSDEFDLKTLFIKPGNLQKLAGSHDYLNYAEIRSEEIRDWLTLETQKTIKNERKLSTIIKRCVLSALSYNADGEYASNEAVLKAQGKTYNCEMKEIMVVKSGSVLVKRYPCKDKTESSIYILLFVQILMCGTFWGFMNKIVPKMFGYDYSTFLKGCIYGCVPFMLAVLLKGEIHSWLSVGFWMGILPMVEGIILGICARKEYRRVKSGKVIATN